jgi:hypothetical protein
LSAFSAAERTEAFYVIVEKPANGRRLRRSENLAANFANKTRIKYNKEERAQGEKNVGFQQTGLYQDTLEPCQRAKMRSLGWS